METAVTGWALRTPLGTSVDQVVRRLLAGERAAQLNHRFPSETYVCRLAATIPVEPLASLHGRVLRRIGLFGIEVAVEALRHAGSPSGERLGLFSAIGGLRAHWDDIMPALANQRDDFQGSWNRGLKNLHPFWMLQHLSNNAHALLAEDIGAKGEGVTFGGANAGAQALVAAIHALEADAIDAALVVACDSVIEPETIVEMAARGALASCDLEDLRAPYDEQASGVVPGEAAAALILERIEHRKQAALVYLEAAACADGEKCDPAATTIGRVVARLARGDTVIDGCSLARKQRDAEERAALAGAASASARLTSIQAATGYLGAATPLVQTIAMGTLLKMRQLPPIAGLRQPANGELQPLVHVQTTDATSALAVSAGAPGLVGAIRIALPYSRTESGMT